jgi:hypothetical protein
MAMSPEEKAKAKSKLEKELAAESKKREPKIMDSVKVGAKQALKGAAKVLGGGGMAERARTSLAKGKSKTKSEIEKQTK